MADLMRIGNVVVTDDIAILVFSGLVGIALLLNYLAEKKRREELIRTARMLGLQYQKRPEPGFLSNLSFFPLGTRGHSPGCSHVMQGEYRSRPAFVFDYTYTTGSGKNRTTHNQTVVFFPSFGEAHLAEFSVRPEHFFDKVANSFGHIDINFPDDKLFSAAQRLHGKDEEAVRLLFNDSVRHFLIHEKDHCVESASVGIVFYRKDVRTRPDTLRLFLDRCSDLFSMFEEASRR